MWQSVFVRRKEAKGKRSRKRHTKANANWELRQSAVFFYDGPTSMGLFGRAAGGRKKESLLPHSQPATTEKERSARVSQLEQHQNEAPKRGCCARLCSCLCRSITLMFPLNGCLFIMLALYVLAQGETISEVTVSECMANYGNERMLLTLMFIGASCIFVTGAMRKIQFRVYQQRNGDDSKLWHALNIISAASLILAYVGWCVLAIFNVDENTLFHNIGAFTYFILSNLFGLIHMAILWKQKQYPLYLKIVFSLVPIAATASSIVYMLSLSEVGVIPDTLYTLEWLAIALHALLVGCTVLLFFHDPVDDELRDFFCCRRRGRGGSGKRSSGIQMKKRQSEGTYTSWDDM